MEKLQPGAKKADGTAFSPEEIADHNQFIDTVQAAVKEEMVGMITKEESEAIVAKAIAEATEPMKKEYEKLYKSANKQGEEITKMKLEAAAGNKPEAFDIEKQLHIHKDALQQFFATKGKSGSLNIILKTEYTRASVTSNPMGMMLPEIGLVGAPKIGLYEFFSKIPVGPESNGVVRYLDQTTQTRAAATRAESAAYPESAIAFQGYTLPIEKIGDSIPVTDETFRHTARLAAEIEMFLQTNVALAVESNLATGDGTTPNLKGVYTSATAYTAPAAGLTDPNIYDLIVKMQEDITGNTTYGGKYMPDFALMNITDINAMKLKKDANNNYIIPPFASRDGRQVNGITVIESPFITANTMVLGDKRFARIYTDGEIELGAAYVASDWLQDVVSLKARRYLALLIRTIDATGFRKSSDIGADVLTLATV